MSEKCRRYFLKAKESKQLLTEASKRLGIGIEQIFGDKSAVEILESESTELFLLNGKPVLTRIEGAIYPVLTFKEFVERSPRITVDMGAVPYVCKGANIMAPGIRRFEGTFKKGDFVVIVDEKHGKPLALGESLYDVEEAKTIKQGIMVKNLHYVGDKTWNRLRQLT